MEKSGTQGSALWRAVFNLAVKYGFPVFLVPTFNQRVEGVLAFDLRLQYLSGQSGHCRANCSYLYRTVGRHWR
jgi:hypothetical protein